MDICARARCSGVRLALLGCRRSASQNPRGSKKLITWVEIDRCGADAVQTVTGCKPGKRTLKLVDYGKLAATFLNTETGRGRPRRRPRRLARTCCRAAPTVGAARCPDGGVSRRCRTRSCSRSRACGPTLGTFDRPGKPAMRVLCTVCGEEVNDNRHVDGDDGPLCRACAGGAYYTPAGAPTEAPAPW